MGLAGFPEKRGRKILKEKKRTLKINGVSFTFNSLYYYDPDDGHHYTTTEIDTENYRRGKEVMKKALEKHSQKN
ncbi:MAG: hypothetical protein L3J56_12040 [Bacteroidales bacterium]|nr:hypothetical protein [Bacteroidales bacterium]